MRRLALQSPDKRIEAYAQALSDLMDKTLLVEGMTIHSVLTLTVSIAADRLRLECRDLGIDPGDSLEALAAVIIASQFHPLPPSVN